MNWISTTDIVEYVLITGINKVIRSESRNTTKLLQSHYFQKCLEVVYIIRIIVNLQFT